MKEQILKILKEKPILAQELRLKLVSLGFKEKEARAMIAEMWDHGELNVGLIRNYKLHILYKILFTA